MGHAIGEREKLAAIVEKRPIRSNRPYSLYMYITLYPV